MNYFKSDGKYIYLDAECVEFYIPKYYFDDTYRYAENLRNSIHVLGVFDIGILENGSVKEMHMLNLPTMIDIFVNNSEDRDIKLPNEEENTPCTVVTYYKGDKIMYSSIPKDSGNVENFYNFVLKGKIPSIIPYEKSILILKKNQEVNDVHLGVPDVVHELILSVAYRYKNDPRMKFSHAITNDKSVSQYDYVMNNIRQICQYTSTFTALTFEDIDSMITTSLNRTRDNAVEAYSPIESLLKM